MKKILFLFAILIIGTITFAENDKKDLSAAPNTENQTQEEAKPDDSEQTKTDEAEKNDENIPKPDYTTVVKGSQIFYYDKEGKFFARDKKINEQTFFYNKTGQLTGKSVMRNGKTYYYNSLNKFLGVCDEKECFDKDFVSTGKVPPLPLIKTFVPYVDPSITNPKPAETKTEEE